MNSSKEVLGTGLSGLVGSRIIELNPDLNFTDISLDTGINILNPSQLESAFSAYTGDSVIHLAAFTDTNAAWDQRGDKTGLCYRLNVTGTRNIIDMCTKFNKYLIHFSTDFVFDGQKTSAYSEADSPRSLEWYGQTKYEAEQLVLGSGVPAAVVRIAFPYRAKFDAKIDLIRKIKSKLASGQEVTMFNDQFTTPTFVDDIARGIRKIIDTRVTGIYHLVGSSSQSPYDTALLIAKTFGYDTGLVKPTSLSDYLNNPESRPYAASLKLSNEKFVTEFGLKPLSLNLGLEELKRQLSHLL